MTAYRVDDCREKKRFNGTYGESVVYTLALSDTEGQHIAELIQKASTAAPMVGDQLEGSLEKTEYGLRFKKAQKAGGFGGGPRPEDPRRSAHIARMHAQTAALQYAAIKQEQGKLPDDFSLEQLWRVADEFDRDAQRARERA